MSHQRSHNHRAPGGYAPQQRYRRHYGGQNGGYRNGCQNPNGGNHYFNHHNGRSRMDYNTPLIPIPQHRRTSSTHSSISSSSSSCSLSSRFSSYEEQQRYIDSFEATLASDNPFNQAPSHHNMSGNSSLDESSLGSSPHHPQHLYAFPPPPPSKMQRLLQQIRKHDVEKLKTIKTISLEALTPDPRDDWLSQMTVDVFKHNASNSHQPLLEEEEEESFESSSSSVEDDPEHFEFNHHINSLLELISS